MSDEQNRSSPLRVISVRFAVCWLVALSLGPHLSSLCPVTKPMRSMSCRQCAVSWRWCPSGVGERLLLGGIFCTVAVLERTLAASLPLLSSSQSCQIALCCSDPQVVAHPRPYQHLNPSHTSPHDQDALQSRADAENQRPVVFDSDFLSLLKTQLVAFAGNAEAVWRSFLTLTD